MVLMLFNLALYLLTVFYLGRLDGYLRNKVNRCLARYSPRATTTNRPTTGHLISLHGLAQIDLKCQFWAKFGRFWAKNPFLLEKSKVLLPTYGKPT